MAHEHTSAVTKAHVHTATHGLEEVAAPAGHTRNFTHTQTQTKTNPNTLLHTETHASYLLTVKSRLIPVAIAGFRYIMVCHAVLVQNHGGEKRVSCFPPMRFNSYKSIQRDLFYD